MAKDVDLFAAAMAGVKPLKKPAAAKLAKPLVPKPRERSLAPLSTTAVPAAAPELGPFDRDIDRSLSRGKLTPDAKLDLHGLKLAQAERAVARFLEQATDQDVRVALIVTGKGFRQEDGRMVEGRIRAEFMGWLGRPENVARVRAVRPAHPRHGGTGAFYVLLRRRSSASKRSLRSTPQR